jgi:LuxR family transcriptional regulator
MNAIDNSSVALSGVVRRLGRLGPSGYAIVLHLRGLSCRMVERTYPREWMEYYDAQGYSLRDPIIGWCIEHTGPVRWSEPRLPDPYGIMASAAEYGMRYGASTSLGPRDCRSILSVARDDRELTDAEIETLERVAAHIHALLPFEVNLTRKQTEALACIATGMRAKEAANLLGISDSAFKFRIRTIREKLNARTTAEAIQRAKDYMLI